MRFIGNKENLVQTIYQILKSKNISGETFFDAFSGTTSVAKYFKKLGYIVKSNDLMYFSYVLQMAYIQNNSEFKFEKLIEYLDLKSNSLFDTPLAKILKHLNSLELEEGFIYNNYTPTGTNNLEIPRTYFIDKNGKKIDTIRLQIEKLYKLNLISNFEYFALIATLIESVPFFSNISGVYAAFHKKWDPRALKTLEIKEIETIIHKSDHESYNDDSANLLNKIEADIFYLDPPYNQRQYAPNYHLLETIAKYDSPAIHGVTGLRNYDNQKSLFCNANTAIVELEKFAKLGKFSSLVLSYNSEGIMSKDSIIDTLQKYGKVEFIEFDYLRFKSNSNGDSKIKKYIKEHIYILKK